MFQFHQVMHGLLVFDDLGQHLDALVHPVEAHHLSPVEASVLWGKCDLDGQGPGVRIIAGVGGGVDHRGQKRDPRLGQIPSGDAGGGDADVKDLGNGGVDGTGVLAFIAQDDVVRGNAALLVGGPGQIGEEGLSGDGIGHGDGIAHGIDVRIRGLQVFIDQDAFVGTQIQSGRFRQAAVRFDADGEDGQVGGDGLSAGKPHQKSAG